MMRTAIVSALLVLPLFSFPTAVADDLPDPEELPNSCLALTIAEEQWHPQRGIVDFDSEKLPDGCVIWHIWQRVGTAPNSDGEWRYYYYKVEQSAVVCC